MNITVTSAPAATIVVSSPVETVEVEQTVTEVEAVARTVQPELAGFFLERVGEDGWTIWYEDGK